ncbi:MAG TPA: DUF4136 domain-containing protein [Sphingomonas sp.]|nr:DUF4136 domain-containing protein [Sphingomonas sp.]
MSLRRTILTLAAPAALLLASGCATSFRADVSRFQMMPPPEGQTFSVQAADPRLEGGIEFQTYAQLVSARLTALGYRLVDGGGRPTLVVSMDYGVDNGHEQIVTTPGIGPAWGWGPYGGWGVGYRHGPRGFRGPLYGRGFYYGWQDPFWYSPFGYPEINSYTYYVSHLELKIRRAGDGQTLFEGRARARSTDQALPHLVPNLVEAMFTGFPGRSGEDVMITIPPPPKPGQAPAPATIRPNDRH